MNGLTIQTSSFHMPNICKCGHDFLKHNPNVGGFASCFSCFTTTTTPQRHGFTGKKEIWPSAYFTQMLPYGYYAPGGLGKAGITTRTALANQNAGNTTVLLQSVVGILPGMTMLIMLPTPVNFFSYFILSVNRTGNSVTIPTPGLRIVSNNVAVVCYGSFGSMMGPGQSANNQRGG